jgi:hypothetical protein
VDEETCVPKALRPVRKRVPHQKDITGLGFFGRFKHSALLGKLA